MRCATFVFLALSFQILCIHGYRQNGQTFRERTGSLRKLTKKQAELVFITAPNRVPPLEGNDEKDSDERGWWFSRPDDYYKAQDITECCKGYEESMAVIKQAIQEQGPFDGILGFSQGASMVSLLCGMKEQNHDMSFDFAILIAGFKSRSSPHDVLYEKPIACPTLHVFGETDKVIEKELSRDLLQYFVDPRILQHPGGHFIPTSGLQKTVYQEFLRDMLAKKHNT